MNNHYEEVTEVLKTLLPAMQTDGGGVELVSVKENVVFIRFQGACLLCPSIGMTMKHGIIKTLTEKLPWVKEVVRVS